MSKPQPPQPAKLVIGIITAKQSLLKKAMGQLISHFGEVDMMSQWMTFDYTTYYQSEMGAPLFRRMIVHRILIQQDGLPEIKRTTNDIEDSFRIDGQRPLNIDPGYLLQERFVLATGKNYSHRIYLRKGIYADLTLIYQKKGYQSLEWTYPDYSSREMKTFLEKVREKYRWDLERKEIS